MIFSIAALSLGLGACNTDKDKKTSSQEPASSQSESSSQAPSEENGHGPEGSSPVSWYLVGKGSIFKEDWSVSGGVQMFSNPGSVSDKGCILGIVVAQDDIFKVTDGNTWFGYDKVDQWDDPSNAGKTHFTGVDDGYGGLNFKCTTGATFDIYVNGSGNFWIQLSA